jgi:L-threo-3-deoxy-hexylosonate aldolase
MVLLLVLQTLPLYVASYGWNPTFLICVCFKFAVVKLFELSEASIVDPSFLPEAQRLQGIVGRADATIAKTSISGTKYLLQKLYGYGGHPRRPLPPIDVAAGEALWEHSHTQALVSLEQEVSGKVQ